MTKDLSFTSLKRIGAQIKYFRKIKGLSQKDFAKKLNVTWETVSRWENGRVSPLHKLSDIADTLAVPISYLLNIHDQHTNYNNMANTGIAYVGELPQTPKELTETYKKSLFTLKLEKFIPQGSFAVKASEFLLNKTPVPVDNNTILIINTNVLLKTRFVLWFNPKQKHFILESLPKSQKTKKSSEIVASVIAIILQ